MMEKSIADYTAYLNELQSFVLHHSDTLQLYRQYLSQSATPTLANHIDFYQDIRSIEKAPQQNKLDKEKGENVTYLDIYTKYFSDSNPLHLLDIKQEIINEVRENIHKVGSVAAFKPALYAVIRDLCFENLTSFTASELFQEFKAYLKVGTGTDEMLNMQPKERNSTLRLRKFFGEKVYTKDANRLSFRSQPRHVKSYRLNKRFGERVLVEYNLGQGATDGESGEGTSPGTRDIPAEWRTSRRLHVFFGDAFTLDEVLFSEKIRAPFDSEGHADEKRDISKQPDHVHPHRLNRFFGERLSKDSAPILDTDSDDISGELIMDMGDEELENIGSTTEEGGFPMFILSRYARNQRIIRFFGERIDASKEALYKTFANQPSNVRPLKLKKIFGTAAATCVHSDEPIVLEESGPPKKAKRAHKLHKFFGMSVKDVADASANLEVLCGGVQQ